MQKIWNFVKHNSGIIIGSILAIAVLIWCYGCESKVVSITNTPQLITRPELELEVDHFLKQAEIRFAELDQQDEFKRTFFTMAISFMETGQINPLAIALTIGNLLGFGAIVDNVRKRTLIATMKAERETPVS